MNKCITIWLFGGLGNQLFQIQYGIWLKSMGYSVVFNSYLCKVNVSTNLLRWCVHEYVLEELIADELLFDSYIEPFALISSKMKYFDFYSKFYGVTYIPLAPSRNAFGYFQCSEFSVEAFENGFLPHITIPKEREGWVMHLRGGDVVVDKNVISYYARAIHRVDASIVHVVTNSEELLNRIKILCPQTEFVNIGSCVISDFTSLACFENVILGPSTFSWWAARLGLCKNAIIPKSIQQSLGSPKKGSQFEAIFL